MLGLGLTSYVPYAIYYAALGFILIAFVRPKLSLYFLIALLPLNVILQRLVSFPLGKDINDLLYIGILAGWFFNVRDERGKIITYAPLNKYMFYIIIFSFVSYIFGSIYWGLGNPFDFGNSRFINWKNFIMLPVLYLMAVNLLKSRKEIKLTVMIMIVILLLADMHFYANMEGRDLSNYRKDIRSGGIFPDLGPNELAAFYAHFIFLPLGLMFYEKRRAVKLIYLSISAFTLYPVLFLFSRGAYFATFMGLLFMGIKKSKVLVICLIILLISWVTILPHAVVERINMTETEEGIDASSAKRLEYWKLGFSQFLRNPIIGVGFDTSRIFRGGDLHSEYVELLSEQGIIGLMVFLTLLFKSFKIGTWLNANAKDEFIKGLGLAMSCIVIACAITNLFGDRWTYLELSAFLFVLIACVSNSRKIAVSDNSEFR
jgi:O-antigen ligase